MKKAIYMALWTNVSIRGNAFPERLRMGRRAAGRFAFYKDFANDKL